MVCGLEMWPRYKSFAPSNTGLVISRSSLIQKVQGLFGVVQSKSFLSLLIFPLPPQSVDTGLSRDFIHSPTSTHSRGSAIQLSSDPAIQQPASRPCSKPVDLLHSDENHRQYLILVFGFWSDETGAVHSAHPPRACQRTSVCERASADQRQRRERKERIERASGPRQGRGRPRLEALPLFARLNKSTRAARAARTDKAPHLPATPTSVFYSHPSHQAPPAPTSSPPGTYLNRTEDTNVNTTPQPSPPSRGPHESIASQHGRRTANKAQVGPQG